MGFHSTHLDDLDFNPSDHVDFLRGENFRQLSQEFRVLSPSGGKIEYMLGVSYLRNSWHSLEHLYWNTPGFPPRTPIAGQLYNGPFVNDFSEDTTSKSLFANGLWRAAEALRVSVALRYTDEGKQVRYGRTNSAPFTLWNVKINPPFPITPLVFDGSFLDGNFALEHYVGTDTSVYLSYGRSNKLVGFVETNGVPSANPAVDARIESETTSSVELGIKLHAFSKRLALNLAMFDMEIANF